MATPLLIYKHGSDFIKGSEQMSKEAYMSLFLLFRLDKV